MTSPQTEILVHIAASSRASDDARYRALARAYAEFVPAGLTPLTSEQSGNKSAEDKPENGSFSDHVSANIISQSFESVNLSFNSVWDNVQSPGIVRVQTVQTMVTTTHVPFGKRPQPYVSPDDFIPDSQSQEEHRRQRRRISESGLDLEDDIIDSARPQHIYDVSRIEESQELGSDLRSTDPESSIRLRSRSTGSPDLSAMPLGVDMDMSLDMDTTESIVLEDSQDRPRSQQLLPRQPLQQRSANSQQSSQNNEIDDSNINDAYLKSSPPLHEWKDIPSSIVVASSSPELGARQPSNFSFNADIPSSLPEESGKVVLQIQSSSCEHRGLSASLPSSGVPALQRDGSTQSAQSAQSELIPATQPQKTSGLLEDRESKKIAFLRSLSQTFPSSSPTPSAPGFYGDQSLRIVSPEPPVACETISPDALITEKMAKLAAHLDIERRYKPLPLPSGRREPRPFERGYWRLNTSAWPATLRRDAWSFLQRYIGGGDAGWSVWCSRDPAPHTWLRLSCFAATAGHTYLVLYLASQRQILTTGVEWMDGTGTPAITVPPRKRKQTGAGSVDVFTNAY